MNFKEFRIAYHSFLLVLRVAIFLAIFLWAKNSYHYFQENKLIDFIVNIDSLEKNFSKIWQIIKFWLIDTGWFIIKIVVIKVIISVCKGFSIQSKWLVYWDNLGEICPILGREIANHFRHNKSISFVTLMDLYKYSSCQMALLKIHEQDENVQQIFRKYDSNYEKDLDKS